MAVPTVITDLSTTVASNSPAGGDTVTTNAGPDDFLRALSAIIRREQAKGANVASASTVDLGAIADGSYVHITGTTTITAFGTVAAGVERTLVFDGILTLTHNGTSLILPSGANLTTAAGDVGIFRSEGSGNWKCVSYTRASGASIAASGSYQPLDATLTALAGTLTAANKIPYATATDTAAELDLSTSTSLGTSNTTLSTQGAVKSYVDTAVATKNIATQVAPSTDGNVLTSDGAGAWVSEAPGGMTLLGTLTTTSGSTATLSTLNLSSYKLLMCMLNGVSHNNGTATNIRLDNLVISASGDNTMLFTGVVWVDLVSGKFNSTVTQESDADLGKSGDTSYDTLSTSIQFQIGAGSFDAGTIRVWGVK